MIHHINNVINKYNYKICKFSVCEEVNSQKNLFEDDQAMMSNVVECSDVKQLIQNPNELHAVEEKVKTWIKRVQEVCIFSINTVQFFTELLYYIQGQIYMFCALGPIAFSPIYPIHSPRMSSS